jgi:cell filamentation protein
MHPFREGNGRTQLQYLKQLAQQAAHSLDLAKLDRAAWLRASREAYQARFDSMARCIERALDGPR